MTFEEATARLVALARKNDGTVTAAEVEADPELASDRDLVSAAARALAGGTNVFSAEDDDPREWFPYSTLTFSELPGRRR
jgi:hypothetical protein